MEKMLLKIPEQMSSSFCWRRWRWMWCKTTGRRILLDSKVGQRETWRKKQSHSQIKSLDIYNWYVGSKWESSTKLISNMAEVLPGKENNLLSTVRAMDCSFTTSIDWPMCTVLGMLPKVPLTNSATSCTVNICSNSSKMAGKELSRAAWCGRKEQKTKRCLLTCFGVVLTLLSTKFFSGLLKMWRNCQTKDWS